MTSVVAGFPGGCGKTSFVAEDATVIDARQWAEIRRLHEVEGLPPGTISRQLGVHHTTVTRALEARNGGEPTLRARKRRIDDYLDFVKETLKEYPKMPASRLYDMTCSRGYQGSPDHFRHLIAEMREKKVPEAFLRLIKLAGEEAQVDWGYFGTLDVGRAKRRLSAFVMVLSYSRAGFVRFCYEEKMAAFLRAHQAAFAYFGGVPRRILYDNLKSAVIRRFGETILFNDELSRFAGTHHYAVRAAAPRRGNEKGRVERTIRFVRSSFWPGRSFKDLTDLNEQVIEWCSERAMKRPWPQDRARTVQSAYEEELPKLLPLVGDMTPIEDIVDVSVPKTPYIRFDRNDYSVPSRFVQSTLTVRATDTEVRIMKGPDVVAHHRRSFGKGETIEDADHVAELRQQKRAGRKGFGLHRLIVTVPTIQGLLNLLSERGQNVGTCVKLLLRELDLHGAEQLRTAIEEALAKDAPHPQAIRHILERRHRESKARPRLPVMLPEHVEQRDVQVRAPRLADFDRLLGNDASGIQEQVRDGEEIGS